MGIIDHTAIRDARLKKKISQAEAAKFAGLAGAGKWSEIETGKKKNVTTDTLERIARALGVKAKDLLK